MEVDALSLRAGLCRPDGQGDNALEYPQFPVISFVQDLHDVPCVIRPHICHCDQYPGDGQPRIDLPLYFRYCPDQLFKSFNREELGLHRYDYFVCRRKCIDRQHTERRGAVQDNHIVCATDCLKVLAQDRLPAHGVHQRNFKPRKLNVCGEKVNTFLMVEDSPAFRQGRIRDNRAQHCSQSDLHLVRMLIAKACRHGTLCIHVYQKDFFSLTGQSDAKTYGTHGLRASAFLITQAVDCSSHGYTPSLTRTVSPSIHTSLWPTR
ncbi:hypothetical protein IMSAGC003_00298 [Lachnospiraceae bacterium]|nr:hypothetical protein IMSAGC003_00298 [Lachnospiraceae bacterium]